MGHSQVGLQPRNLAEMQTKGSGNKEMGRKTRAPRASTSRAFSSLNLSMVAMESEPRPSNAHAMRRSWWCMELAAERTAITMSPARGWGV